ncbi:MAG: ABC transporter permease [Clostridiales bacterium]|nr:ABC transporter permease [Clostridiales bacterium]
MKKNGVFSRLALLLTAVFLYAPIVVLIVFSFNSSKSRTVWTGFSLEWYRDLFEDSRILSALITTLEVSVLAMIISTVLGTMAAIGFFNMKKRPRSVCMAVNNIPMTNADIITGVSLMLLFVFAIGVFNSTLGSVTGTELKMGFGTLLLAHITFDIPYVILSVMPKLRQCDPNIEEAALDLGATPWQAFTKVVLPEIQPGVVNGAIMAFTMSVDDFVISYFTAGSNTSTLAMEIYSMTRKRISPEINALSTLLFAVVLSLLAVVNIRSAQQERAAARREAELRQKN